MKITETYIKGVLILEPQLYEDERGYFFESFSEREFAMRMMSVDVVSSIGMAGSMGDALMAGCAGNGIAYGAHFVQDNEAWSRRGVVRGLHYQLPPYAQAKLVRVVQGRVVDVAVDLRRGSLTFGCHVAVELSDANHRQLYIPRGCAHGYAVLGDEALLLYKCDDFYAPECDAGVRFDDPALAIDWARWGIDPATAIISERDRALPLLTDAQVFE